VHACRHCGRRADRREHLRTGQLVAQETATLRRRLSDADDTLHVVEARPRPRDEVVAHRQHHLARDRRRVTGDEDVERHRDAALGAVLGRHDRLVDQAGSHRSYRGRDVREWDESGSFSVVRERRVVGVGALGTEVGDADHGWRSVDVSARPFR
jgi:hypothetical protein